MSDKTYTKLEIVNTIDTAIKDAMNRKNKYIQLNGYDGADRFDFEIATLSALYSRFE